MKKIKITGERINESFDYNSFIEQKATYYREVEKIKNKRNLSIIDCACGTGYGSEYIAKNIIGSLL